MPQPASKKVCKLLAMMSAVASPFLLMYFLENPSDDDNEDDDDDPCDQRSHSKIPASERADECAGLNSSTKVRDYRKRVGASIEYEAS